MRAIRGVLAHPRLFDVKQRLVTAGYRSMYAAFDRRFPLGGRRGLRVLDVGCGSGLCVNRLFSAERNFMVGVDLDESYVRLAATRFTRCRFIVGDAGTLPFSARCFDVILLSSLIHHLSDEQAGRLFDGLAGSMTGEATLLLSEPIWSHSAVSNMFLRCDRGEYVRRPAEYRALVSDRFLVENEFFFRYAATEFLGLVLRVKRRELLTVDNRE